jgi:hypothetical protein
LNKIEIQLGTKSIENLFMNTMLKKKKLKKKTLKEIPFHVALLENELNKV